MTLEKCMSVEEMQHVLKTHGYFYGKDAAECALVGYQLALELVLAALPKEFVKLVAEKLP